MLELPVSIEEYRSALPALERHRLTMCRQVDMLDSMSIASRAMTHKKPRQIVGFSLDPAMAAEVKTEAAKRGLALKKLFEEMWHLYKKAPKLKNVHGG